MNIFAFDPDPNLSALWLDDIRKNKLILESCQMLSNAMYVMKPTHEYPVYGPFKLDGHRKHGCSVWAYQSWANFKWLTDYTEICLTQRQKDHKCWELIKHFRDFLNDTDNFKDVYLTPFSNNAANRKLGLSFKHVANTNAAYRAYVKARWQMDTIKLTWEHGQQPWWR